MTRFGRMVNGNRLLYTGIAERIQARMGSVMHSAPVIDAPVIEACYNL